MITTVQQSHGNPLKVYKDKDHKTAMIVTFAKKSVSYLNNKCIYEGILSTTYISIKSVFKTS